jgi:hypothetical protein
VGTFETDLKEIGCENADQIHVGEHTVAGYFEHGAEFWGAAKDREFIE